ncbi:MAG TPA: ABC transporter ATP-binding protein [Humibacter sp.]|jgi:ABC-2 type transport system ATP-binding protein|nr:ABC transporter ATP-binding protein [Humibacter sp.]
MIEIEGLTKRYGPKLAVDDVSFTVRPGIVTGFLGPNGAGKSTTMRMIVGLDKPTAGTALVDGKPYAKHPAPLHEVGALLEAKAVHTGRTAFNHLRALAATHGIPKSRVHDVIAMTGLESVANKRVGSFSLGMGQRLGIAAALLGDPHTLILDEPVNGLDPEGVRWVREFCRYLASEGRTVFISSHLMSEMSQTADHLIVLGRGRVLADAPIADVIAGATRRVVRVRTPQVQALTAALAGPDITVTSFDDGALEVSGVDAARIGDIAAASGLPLHELTPVDASLEEAYLELTQDEVEYHSEVTR